MPLSSVMTEVLLAVVSVVVASTVAGLYISSMNQASDLQKLQLAKIKEEIEYSCKVVFAHGRDSATSMKMWVKNTGARSFSPQLLEYSEIIILRPDGITYARYGNSPPGWRYNLINDVDRDGNWDPSETVEVEVSLEKPLIRGDYQARLILFNGKACDYRLSV